MKTITKTVLLIILLSISKMYGQYYNANDYFPPYRYSEITDINNYSASTTFDFYNSEPKTFNVHFYGLETTDGNNPSPLDENYFLEVIAKLNIAFNPYNIFFKYRGYDFYSEIRNGSELINQTHDNIMNRMYEVAQEQGTDNNINIVLHHILCNNDKGSANIYKKIISLRYCTSEPIRVVYQMGHLLGLFKTQQGTVTSLHNSFLNPNPCDEIPDYNDMLFFHIPNASLTPENVTRDTTNSNYNADTAGDMVTDTPAAFAASEHNFCHLYNGNSTYDYISHPNIVDESSEHLMYENLDMLNFMCLRYSYLPAFERNHFTNGQGVRMRETIAIPSLNFNAVVTSIASLYEPYKSEYITTVSDDIYSLTDNGDGTAEECRWRDGTYYNYFQPGFDYEFSFDTDLDFSFPKEQLPFVIDEGRFRVVKIIQINPSFLDENDFYIDNYDNLTNVSTGVIKFTDAYHNSWGACETVPFLRAKIITKENLGSPYSQLQELNNQQEASNPNLEQNLENNKFHIIEKTTTSGAKIQKTIYKNGN